MTTHASLLFALALAPISGCTSTAADDAALTMDAFAFSLDTGTDAQVALDAPSAVDAPLDTFVPTDTFVAHDGGHDAAASTSVDCDACNAQDGMECAFAIADGCSAVAQCVAIPVGSGCGAIQLITACDCSGNDQMWHGGCRPTFPDGMGPAPIAHMGSCP